jgi:hypothetical protein
MTNEIDRVIGRVGAVATVCPRPAKRGEGQGEGPASLWRPPLTRRPSSGDLSPPSRGEVQIALQGFFK